MKDNEDPDRKYYNIVMANNETASAYTYASYKDVLNQQIIKDPSKYYLTILRFQIPTADIPILIPEIAPFGPLNPTGDVNKTVYNVTLEYDDGINVYTSTQYVMYITSTTTNYSVPRPIDAQNPNPMKNPNDYYFIYNYRTFIDMVNNAFIDAFNAISANLPIGTTAPFITYNGATSLMTLHASSQYLSSLPNPVNIYMNYKLFTFFDGIEFLFNDYLQPKGVEILVKDYNGTNFDGTYYLMSQQYPSLSSWNTFKSIQITSQFLPSESEIIPVPNFSGINNSANTFNTLSVVKDFVPFYENGYEFRSFINFRFSGAYELIDLNSNVPISTVDINVYWLDRYGNRYLVSIPYNQILSIKFCFIKKSTFTG